VALTFTNIDISGDPSKVLCTQEEAISWFSSLKEEYEESISKLGRCSFNLAFLTKAEIQDMNKRFAGKNKPTNVLSFPNVNKFRENGRLNLGDIVISYNAVYNEAKERKIHFIDHFRHLLVHGILHLNGFEHDNVKSMSVMENLEIEILSNYGISNPYL